MFEFLFEIEEKIKNKIKIFLGYSKLIKNVIIFKNKWFYRKKKGKNGL